jgi:uncharacterized membrane protein
MSSVVTEQVEKRVPPTGTREWWILYLLGPLLAFGAGLLLVPELVYDRFVWQYLWGPVVADAAGQPVTHEGITAVAGYNPVNTVTYLAIVLYSLPGLRTFLQRYEIDLDTRLAYGFAPLIIAGGAMRALEDAQLLPASLDVLFITPSIYFVMAGVALVSLLIGVVLRERDVVSLPMTVAGLGTGWALLAVGWAMRYGLTDAETFRLVVPVLTTSIALLVTGGFYAAGAIPALSWLDVRPEADCRDGCRMDPRRRRGRDGLHVVVAYRVRRDGRRPPDGCSWIDSDDARSLTKRWMRLP